MWLLRRIWYSGDPRFFSSYGRWMTQGVWSFCVTCWNINVSNRWFLFKPRSKETTNLVNIVTTMKYFYGVTIWDVLFGNFKLRNLLHNTVLVLTSINICCHRINVLIFICRKTSLEPRKYSRWFRPRWSQTEFLSSLCTFPLAFTSFSWKWGGSIKAFLLFEMIGIILT